MFYGRCFTVCSFERFGTNEFINFQLKRNFDIKLAVHTLGEECWLSGEDGKSPSNAGLPISILRAKSEDQVLISPTIYKQLFLTIPFRKENTNTNCKLRKAVHNTFDCNLPNTI